MANESVGENILKAISQLRDCCHQISLLLQSADAIFTEQGWGTVTGNAVTAHNSFSMDNPRWWIPGFYFRYYSSEKYPTVLMFVAVLLDDREGNDTFDFKEPIITCGYLYGYDTPKDLKGYYWRCRWHVYVDPEEKNYEGRICKLLPKEEWEEHRRNFSFMKSLAVPLTSITSSDELQKTVIEPILNELRGEQLSSKPVLA